MPGFLVRCVRTANISVHGRALPRYGPLSDGGDMTVAKDVQSWAALGIRHDASPGKTTIAEEATAFQMPPPWDTPRDSDPLVSNAIT
jgi:hypothetical protein